jgi:cob(I)alamin adenosyltransferase
MGNRLTQIVTRTGDQGTTGLGDNSRVSKTHLRIHAMGDVDELNSHLGVLLSEELPEDVHELLVDIQHQLFNLGGELSMPGYSLLKESAVLQLDEALAHHNAHLPKLLEFILPAGSRAASLARAAPSEPSSLWANKKASAMLLVSISTGCQICCSSWPEY